MVDNFCRHDDYFIQTNFLLLLLSFFIFLQNYFLWFWQTPTEISIFSSPKALAVIMTTFLIDYCIHEADLGDKVCMRNSITNLAILRRLNVTEERLELLRLNGSHLCLDGLKLTLIELLTDRLVQQDVVVFSKLAKAVVGVFFPSERYLILTCETEWMLNSFIGTICGSKVTPLK